MTETDKQAIEVAKAKATRELQSYQEEPSTQLAKMAEAVVSFNWKSMPPPFMARLLMEKTYRGGKGEHYKLTFGQAFIYATRCFELGVSPLGHETWFNRETCDVELTVEGRQSVARLKGLNLGTPQFRDLDREWPKWAPKARLPAGLDKDHGVQCSIQVANQKPVIYTAWLSEWAKGNYWNENWPWMLRVRAEGCCIELVSGVGVSAPHDKIAEAEIPEEIPVTAVEIKPAEIEKIEP